MREREERETWKSSERERARERHVEVPGKRVRERGIHELSERKRYLYIYTTIMYIQLSDGHITFN